MTYGIMFMAVPHRGSKSADYADVVSGVVKIATPFSSTFLKALKPNNDNLTVMSRQFGFLQKEYDIRFVSVLEGERTKVPGLMRGSAEVGTGNSSTTWTDILTNKHNR
jgi:hypothetical protein